MVDKGYRFVFKTDDFPAEVVKETKTLISKFWTEERNQAICDWLNNVSRILGVNAPRFVFKTDELGYEMTGGGMYIPELKTIIMFKKYSLTTLLHEYRHYLQYELNISNTMIGSTDIEFKEDDARAWSTSLYLVCDPKRFGRAMNKGIIKFV